jgi:hypothetical protein
MEGILYFYLFTLLEGTVRRNTVYLPLRFSGRLILKVYIYLLILLEGTIARCIITCSLFWKAQLEGAQISLGIFLHEVSGLFFFTTFFSRWHYEQDRIIRIYHNTLLTQCVKKHMH